MVEFIIEVNRLFKDLIAKIFGIRCPLCGGKLNNIRPSSRPIYDIWECSKCSSLLGGRDLLDASVVGYNKTDPTGRKAVLQRLSKFHCEHCGKNFNITERQTLHSSRIKCPRCGKFTVNDWFIPIKAEEVNNATETA